MNRLVVSRRSSLLVAGALLAVYNAECAPDESRADFIGSIYGQLVMREMPKKLPPLFVAMSSDDELSGQSGFEVFQAWQKRGIAKAIKESGIPRSEIWITSKFWPTDYSNGNGTQSIDKMLERLGTDYVDLIYLHQPVGDYMAGYRALEEAVRQGKVRASGLSTFELNEEVFEDVYSKAEIKPVIDY